MDESTMNDVFDDSFDVIDADDLKVQGPNVH
jgi:hypothetical protein